MTDAELWALVAQAQAKLPAPPALIEASAEPVPQPDLEVEPSVEPDMPCG